MNLDRLKALSLPLQKRQQRQWPRQLVLFLIVIPVLATIAHAQGGPPFRTDDPETPGNRNWEINFGWVGERSTGEGSYSIPDVDLNYGLGDRIQLKFELPIVIHEIRQVPNDTETISSTT